MTEWSTMKVLVTGGSQGIGLGIAEGFARAGVAVAISGRSAVTLQRAAGRLREIGHHIEVIVADVSAVG
jgi:3-oxoacyl-[acyl-carrier protein] reductase